MTVSNIAEHILYGLEKALRDGSITQDQLTKAEWDELYKRSEQTIELLTTKQ